MRFLPDLKNIFDKFLSLLLNFLLIGFIRYIKLKI